MTPREALGIFLDRIPSEYPKHMLCFFAANAERGVVLPVVAGLCRSLAEIDSATPGYAKEMVERLAAIKDTGEAQYEAVLQILAEIYVTQGIVEAATRQGAVPQVAHEPGPTGKKNPECEAVIAGHWCAIEVKTPKLIEHGRLRSSNPWQVTARVPREGRVIPSAVLDALNLVPLAACLGAEYQPTEVVIWTGG